MPRRPTLTRRLTVAATWPLGVALTGWDYLWRTTPMHRREFAGTLSADGPPPLALGVALEDMQPARVGVGPLFHRRYRARIRDARIGPHELMARVQSDLNRAAPTEFARFEKVRGVPDQLRVGDEYVVRMPGPWDGPVRVVEVTDTAFVLSTLTGHLEAGQIRFSTWQDDLLIFQIESWARSGDRFSNLLYHRLHAAKEIQLHMWISFLERVVEQSGGRLTGGLDIETHRVAISDEDRSRWRSGRGPDRRLAALERRGLNFDPATDGPFSPERGWHVDDRCQPLAGEPPGPPVPGGTWETARQLMRGYEFADPSIVRASYDLDAPLESRTMLLELRYRGLRVPVGVRVGDVYEQTRQRAGRTARVWGWNYRTLEGHVERGQMAWEVWKWLDTGDVEFRIHAFSRRAPIANPIIALGFRLVGQRERVRFMDSTLARMRTITDAALHEADATGATRSASEHLTAHRSAGGDAAHTRLAARLRR